MAWQALDEYVYTTDQPASALVPVTTYANVQQLASDTHSGTAHTYDSARRCWVSTPSDVWRAIPVQVLVDESTTSVEVALRYDAVIGSAAAGTNAVDVRLVTPESVGGASTLVVTSAAATAVLSCAYTGRRREVIDCEIQIRSRRAAAPIRTAIDLREVNDEGLRWEVSGGSGLALATGIAHYEAVLVATVVPATPPARANYHIGFYDTLTVPTSGFAWVWPSSTRAVVATGDAKFDGEVEVYDLGALRVIGWSAYSSGDRDPVPPVPAETRQSDQPTSAGGVLALYQGLARIYARGRVWASGVNPTGTDACLGARVSGGDTVIGAIADVAGRGSSGVAVRVRYTAPAGVIDSPEVVWTLEALDGSGASLGTYSWTGSPVATVEGESVVEPALNAGDLHASEALHGVLRWAGGTGAGWRDAMRAGESVTPIGGSVASSVVVRWNDLGVDPTADDYAELVLTADADTHVWSAAFWEVN